jgi:hypothetical protein
VKLKKLHKMGDVVNTILKHFEKEKMIIDQNKNHIFCVFLVKSLLFLDNQKLANQNYSKSEYSKTTKMDVLSNKIIRILANSR